MKIGNFLKATLFFSVCIFLIVQGCGGGGDGSSTTSGIVTVSTDAPWVAYQVDSSPWQRLSASSNERYTFEIGSSGKFGVAIGDTERITVYQAIYAEASLITRFSDRGLNQHTVSGRVINVGSPPNFARVDISDSFVSNLGNNDPYTLSVAEGKRDIVGIEFEDNFIPSPVKFQVIRDADVMGDLVNQDLDFTTGFPVLQRSINLSGGTNTFGEVSFITKNGTTQGISLFQFWYEAWGGGGTVPGDRYIFEGEDVSGNSANTFLEVLDATKPQGDLSFDFTVINSLSPVNADGVLPCTYSDLDYTRNAGSHDFVGFLINQEQSAPGVAWDIVLSPGWLGGQSVYTLPDFSSLQGFGSLNQSFQQGSLVEWKVSAAMSTRSIGDLLSVNEPEEIIGIALHLSSYSGSFTP